MGALFLERSKQKKYKFIITMKILETKVDKIKVFQNIRSASKDVSALMSSMEHDGLSHPIGVYRKNGEFTVAYGHRRLQAAKKLGWKTIPAVIIEEEFTEEGFLTKNTIENIHREDINPIELGRVCKLFQDKGLSVSEIGVKLHVPARRVQMVLGLYKKLPKEYWNAIGFVARGAKKKGIIPAAVAITVLQLRLNKAQVKDLLEFAKKHELGTREIHLIEKLKRTGLSYEEIMANLDHYAVKNIVLAINKSAWDKRGNPPITEYIKEIIRGNEPPNKDLLI